MTNGILLSTILFRIYSPFFLLQHTYLIIWTIYPAGSTLRNSYGLVITGTCDKFKLDWFIFLQLCIFPISNRLVRILKPCILKLQLYRNLLQFRIFCTVIVFFSVLFVCFSFFCLSVPFLTSWQIFPCTRSAWILLFLYHSYLLPPINVHINPGTRLMRNTPKDLFGSKRFENYSYKNEIYPSWSAPIFISPLYSQYFVKFFY